MLSLIEKLEAFRDGCEEAMSDVLCTQRRVQAFRDGWDQGVRETLGVSSFADRFERFRSDFNPYHVQYGEHGGEFTTGPGGGETWQQVAQRAVDEWRKENTRVDAKTVELVDGIDKMMAEAEKFTDYRDWYDRHRGLARELFGKDEPLFEKFLAAASIQAAGSHNVQKALAAYTHYKLGGDFKNFPSVMPNERMEYQRIVAGQPLSGEKTQPFAEALTGNWDRAPADRHMKQLLFKHPTSSGGNRSQPEATEALIGAMAKRMGWRTAELQAVLWCVEKSRREKGLPGKIFTYKEYIKANEAKARAIMHTVRAFQPQRRGGPGQDAQPELSTAELLQMLIRGYSGARLLLELVEQVHGRLHDDSPSPQAVIKLLKDFNPYHVKSGEHGGEFTTAAGVGGTVEGTKNVRIIPGYGDPIVVHINPSERDLRSMIQDAYEEVVRVILDQKNNLYAWDASQAIHALVWNTLELDPKDWDQFVLYKGKIAAIGAVEGQGLNWKAPGVAEYIKPDFQRARELLNLAKRHHDAKHYDADIYIDAGNPDVEYIQNPETGRFEGSRAQAEHAAQQAERARAAQAAAISITAKKKVEWSDFDKAKVHIDSSTAADPVKKAKFLERWNDSIDIVPEEFHKMFDGGVNSNMSLQYNDYNDTLKINSELLNDNGDRKIGECDRTISFGSNRASLDYFVLTSAQQHGGIAKQVLAADNAVYEKLGLDKIDIHANIDVGGYAWAKYGYVPSSSSWHELQNEIMRRLSRDGHDPRSGGYTPESWDELSNDDQERIESAFQRATYEEFYDSEVENWRESGQALDLAKSDLAEAFMSGDPDKAEWAIAALENVRSKYADQAKPDIPFNNMEVLSAITTSYNSRHGDGRNDVDIDWDDDKLDALVPKGYDPNQLLMSFVEARKPSEYLTEDMRGDIEQALVKEFNSKAEDDADDLEPPEYISEGVSDYQSDYWSSIRPSERYEWARTHDELPTYDLEEEEEETEPEVDVTDDQRAALLKLARSNDPKAIWAIADSPRGKELLLNTNWLGALNLRDPEALARFKAYVGKGKSA